MREDVRGGMSEDKVAFGGAAEDINTNSFSSPGTQKKTQQNLISAGVCEIGLWKCSPFSL